MVCVLKLVLTVAGRASGPLKLFHFTTHDSEEPLIKTKPYPTKHRTGTFDYIHLNWYITLREYAVKELKIDLGSSIPTFLYC